MPNRPTYLLQPLLAALLLGASGAPADAQIGSDPRAAHAAHAARPERPERPERAGIAIHGSGAFAAFERLIVVDSVTGRFLAVIRQPCAADPCPAPLDSASGTLPREEVHALFALASTEHVGASAADHATCDGCADRFFYTIMLQANGSRSLVRAEGETMRDGVRRFQAAVAEAIREVRATR